MADFRKLFLALIAGALLLGTVASAAPIQCSVSAVPTLVRSEGVADFAGDVLLICQSVDGPFPAPTIANVRLRIPGTNITSRIMGTANTPTQNVLESLLILDEAGANGPVPKGYESTSPSLDPFDDGSQNLYQAVQISNDTIEWQGVVLAGPNSYTWSRIIRLTNVRIYPLGFSVGQQIPAILTIQSASASITVTPSNTVPSVAEIQRGLYASYVPLALNNCTPSTDAITGIIQAKFLEGFATAFKPRWNNTVGTYGVSHDTPGGSYLDESGYNPVWPSGSAPSGSLIQGGLIGLTQIGFANNGTRFRVTITNVPAGVTLSVGTITAPNGLQLTGSVDSGSSGGGTWVFTWTVTSYGSPNLSQFQVDQITVNINFSATPPVPVTVSAVNAHTDFRPLAGPLVASTDGSGESDDVPRFLPSTSADDTTVLVINQNCKTVLLFPYLVQLGSSWDSGIAISNTSVDPFGTVNQSGACTLYFYGQASSATVNGNTDAGNGNQVTPTVPAGGQFVMTLSGGGGVLGLDGTFTACSSGNCSLPEFRGYMIASCNFQYAHGFAFISDMGAQKLSQGYLALVVPYRSSMYSSPLGGRPAQNAGLGAVVNEGEQLGN